MSTSGSGRSDTHLIEQANDGKTGYSDHSLSLKSNCEDKGAKRNNLKEKLMLDELEPQTLKALHELVSLVHHRVNSSDLIEPMKSTLASASTDKEKAQHANFVKENLFCLEDDPVATILWSLHPLSFRNVFIAMAHNFPRTLEGLILLSPVGAEVLTRKFDDMDKLAAEEHRNKFYEVFYGSFDDQFNAMDVILRGKESFARQAFKNVLDQYLGVNFDFEESHFLMPHPARNCSAN